MKKQNGITKYFIGAILLVALFIFFASSRGKTQLDTEGQTGGGSSYVEGEGSFEGAPDDMGGDSLGGAEFGEAGGGDFTGPDSGGGSADLGEAGGPELGGSGTGSMGSGSSLSAGPSIGGDTSGGGDVQSVGTIGGAGGDAAGADMQDLGSAGKEPAGNSTESSFTGGYSASSAGGGSKVGSPSSKTDTQSTIGSGLGKYSSKKDDSKPKEDFFEDDFPDENDGGEPETKIPEGGTYTSKQEVALYLHTYHRLPSNYITKKQANQLGWNGGSLEKFAPGKCIGGDFFGNYEGRLPEDHEYHECDIDTLKADNRGEKRLVYSDDFHIYYTDDHYTTFELLYEP